MVGVYAQLKVSSDTTLLLNSSSNFTANNLSSKLVSTLNKVATSSNPYLLGCSDFSFGAELVQDTIPFFVGTQAAGSDGNFGSEYYFSVVAQDGEEISTISIVFDEYNDQHPNTISTSGSILEEHKVVSSRQIITVEPSTIVYITIDNWNTPNFPLKIQGITADVSVDIYQNSLVNLNFSGLDRSDATRPSFGIYSNSGSIEFIDNGNAVKVLKESGLLLNSEIEIFLRNRYRDTQIGSFIISDGKYSLQGGSSKLSFKDRLTAWQDVTIPNNKVLSMSAMKLEDIRHQIATSVKGLDISTYYGDGASSRWSMLWVKTPYVESSSFWAFMTKCCEITGCYISCDEKGRAVIAYGGGT